MKKVREVIGDFVKIDLGGGFHTYARLLDEGVFAFYDARATSDLSIDAISSRPIIFRVAVMADAIKSARWPVIGNAPLEPEFQGATEFFMQDALKPTRIQIYNRGVMRPATKEECAGLERAAVWEAPHVEDRLRDHYAGRPNKWLESLRLKE